ncbi:unnamed protein product, partial [Prorocentrum cordatum]
AMADKLDARFAEAGLGESGPPDMVTFICGNGKSYTERGIDEAFPNGIQTFTPDVFPIIVSMRFKKRDLLRSADLLWHTNSSIRASSLIVDSYNTPELQGVYILEKDKLANGLPVWRCEGQDWWLYNSPASFWGIGGKAVVAENFNCNMGRVVSMKREKGLMPWDVEAWHWSNGETWKEDEGIRVSVADVSLPVGFVPFRGGSFLQVRFPAGKYVADMQMKLLLAELSRRGQQGATDESEEGHARGRAAAQAQGESHGW